MHRKWSTKIPTEPGKYIARINWNGESAYPVYCMKLNKKGEYTFLGRDISDMIADPTIKVEWAKDE